MYKIQFAYAIDSSTGAIRWGDWYPFDVYNNPLAAFLAKNWLERQYLFNFKVEYVSTTV